MQTLTRRQRENPEGQSEISKYHGKCVCDLCKKHQCPMPGYPLETETTHRHFYVPHDVSASPPRRARMRSDLNQAPVRQEPKYKADDFKTNYKTHYSPHKIQPMARKSKNAKKPYNPSPFKLEDQTEYRNKYSPMKDRRMFPGYGQPFASPVPSRCKKREYMPSPFKLEDVTTYNQDYSPKKAGNGNPPQANTPGRIYKKQARPNTAKPQYTPSPFKLEDETQYKVKYSPYKIKTEATPPPPVATPTRYVEYSPPPKGAEYSPSKLRLQTQTSYNKFYTPHQSDSYSPPKFTKNMKRPYQPSPHKLQSETRYREFYKPLDVKPRDRCPTDHLPHRPLRCSPGKNHTYYNSGINKWQ